MVFEDLVVESPRRDNGARHGGGAVGNGTDAEYKLGGIDTRRKGITMLRYRPPFTVIAKPNLSSALATTAAPIPESSSNCGVKCHRSWHTSDWVSDRAERALWLRGTRD